MVYSYMLGILLVPGDRTVIKMAGSVEPDQTAPQE